MKCTYVYEMNVMVEIFIEILIIHAVFGAERVSLDVYKELGNDLYDKQKLQEEVIDIRFSNDKLWERTEPSKKSPIDSQVLGKLNKSSVYKRNKSNLIFDNFERIPEPELLPEVQEIFVQMKGISFDTYHRYDTIVSYLYHLTKKYPSIVNLEHLGKSSEGRDLLAIKISSGGNGTKPIIFIDAGIHASEWLAPAEALYIIQQLVECPDNKKLISNVDWIVFPVVNPDGYEFTFQVTRLWRKTRSKGINCIGTDANRNFDFHWGEAGSSPDECDRRYRGPTPFSEPESRAVRNLMLKYSKNVKLYVTFHTYGQLVLYPWGYKEEPPSNVNELDNLGRRVASAIEKVAGNQFVVGSIRKLLYVSSGDSASWVKGVVGVDLVYAMELQPKLYDLPPLKKILLGDSLPVKAIKRAVTEVFEGVRIFHGHIENKYKVI